MLGRRLFSGRLVAALASHRFRTNHSIRHSCAAGNLGRHLDVAKAYTTMNLFDKLSHPLANRPGLQLILLLPFRLAQACVSVERLSNFLAPDNLEGYALHCPSGCWYVVDAGEVLYGTRKDVEERRESDSLTREGIGLARALPNISFTAINGSLIAVVGPAGRGKSSLLYGHELNLKEGSFQVYGSIAYVISEHGF